ncbi:hypothetical protein N7509_004620 [Penicillium cosmopolitanum]|uniref:Myb-like domain-containing protein n=1 Tax=Penicillium cosmopolitanum TaxID=1131564 RepID=A0A9W9W0U7_9EURO|nr:uncharacterized protein N7509_004620 [Penicillium cosmopolitanum]KAJ5396507.1 hypothetical protein N7509_004620 [Penicillium cosmopolitanum]
MSPPPPPQQISQESIEHSTPISPAKQPTPKSTHRRQSSKHNDLARNMDFLKRRREARQQQETAKGPEGDTTGFFSDMTVPEASSQPPNLSDASLPSPGEVIRNPHGVTMPREIAQTPDEDMQYPPHDNDDTLLNDGEELDLGSYRRYELMQSTSPPGSERARQNYNRGRWFDSSPRNQFTSINEPQQRRTLLDQQEHRTRINFSSEDESQLTEKRMSQKSPAKQETAKRRHDEVENDSDNDDSDDAFDPPESKMVLVSNGASKLLEISNKRQRINTTDEDSSAADQLHDDLRATRDTNQTQRKTSRQPASTQVQSPEPESSRIARARSEAVNPPPSQSRWSQANDPSSATITAANMRRRWTADENERLIQLIGRHGSAWAQIKAQDDICPRSEGGPKLQGRTQVNLKDRARNLKRACEREGTPLPKNFEFIKS